MDFDKVVVMDSGRVVEVGAPWELREQEGSWFGKLWREDERKEDDEDDGTL
jgi:ABC-type multidrug transport system fused ATPase/permease subunit